jgi:hypothetical protein
MMGKTRREAFALTKDEVVAQMHASRMQAYAPLVAPFFGQGSAQNAETAARTFFVSWSPTISEIADVALLPRKQQQQPDLDELSCVEREIRLPPSVLAPSDATVYETPRSAANCQVFIGDCAYAMRKVAINVPCYVGPAGTHLVMSRDHVATRTLMLLRPCAVRVGADGPLCRVMWDAPGTDGVSYDSLNSQSPTAKLAIIALDEGSNISTTMELTTKAVVCYYLSYTDPRMGIPATTDRQVATVVMYSNATASTLRDKAGRHVLRCFNDRGKNTATVTVGSNLQSVSVPTGPGSCVVASWATDCLVVACLSQDRVTLARMPVPRCSFHIADPNVIHRPAPGAPASLSSRLRSTAVPNLADVAARLYPPDSSVKQLSSIMARYVAATPLAPAALGSVLKGGPEYALRPGGVLTSPNGVWTLEFLADGGRLVVRSRAFPTQPREVGSAQPPLLGTITPVMCTLDDATGALSLIGEVSGNTVAYWTSRLEVPDPIPPGTGSPPFELRMTDSGAAQVWGRYANVPLWSSSSA